MGVALLLCAAVFFLLVYPRLKPMLLAGLCCFCGGSLSNLLDRIARGHVVDFINLNWRGLRPYIVNLADITIVLGVILIMWSILFMRINVTNSRIPRKIRV